MTSVNSPVTAESYSISRSLSGAQLPDGTAPKYHRLASFLLSTFIENARPHNALPTEKELQDQFGLSRDTVRRAIAVLQQRGLVYNVQGSGTYVADQRKLRKEPRLISYTEDMILRGFAAATANLGTRMTVASEDVAQKLSVPVDTPLLELTRLRRADSVPMCYEKSRFLPQVFNHQGPDPDLSIDQQLMKNGYRVEKATQRVSAAAASAEEAAALGIETHAPVLRVERVGYTIKGLPVEASEAIYRADRYDYELDLTR